MLSLNHLRTFVAIVEAGSQAAGAQALGLPRSTVSRHLNRLESELSETLLTAEPGAPVRLTAAGRKLYAAASGPISDLTVLDRTSAPRPARDGGKIRLIAPAPFAQKLAGRLVAEFLKSASDTEIELMSAPRAFDLAASDADVGFLVGMEPPAHTRHFALGTLQARLYAAPHAFTAASAPKRPGDLAGHAFVSSDCDGGERQNWTLWRHGDGSVEQVVVRCPLRSDQVDAVAEITCAGLAIGRLPTFVGQPLVDTGRLTPVLPGWSVTVHSVCVALRPGVRNAAAERFMRFVADHYEQIVSRAETDRSPSPAP